jgi:ribose transport system permease protein
MSAATVERRAILGAPGRLLQSSVGTAVGGIALINICVAAIFSITTPDHVFFEMQTLTSVVHLSSLVVLLGIGVACLLGAGEFDISLGANVIFSSVVGAKVMNLSGGSTSSILLGVLACVLAGMAFGAVNGFLVAVVGINSLIATLGMLGVGTGVSLVMTAGIDLIVPIELQSSFGLSELFGVVPLPALVTALVAIAAHIAFRRSRFGLQVLAIGSSRVAAARAGIPVRRRVFALFVVAGGLAGVAAVIDLSRFTTTSVNGHQTDALAAVAGAVIGGTAIFGGRVSILGTVLGCILPVMLAVGLVLQGLLPFYQQIAVGAVLILAVAFRTRQTSAGSS